MPRRARGPRLYLDPKRKTWVIRDGTRFIRTGCAEGEHREAEKQLAQYIGHKHEPQRGAAALIADILLVYSTDHLPHTRTAKNAAYNVGDLAAWWGDKTLADINARNCRAYAQTKRPAAARRDLETLRAAINYWHREYGPLPAIPAVTMPPKSQPRDRWLTRGEAARLLWAARRVQHLARFILLGLYTGSRSGVILGLRWTDIDLTRRTMHRRPAGEAEDARKRTPPARLGRKITGHLRRWHRNDRAIPWVVHYDGLPVKKLRRSWTTARLAAGLDGAVTPHSLRHTRATWLMQDGTPLWEAAGHLGMTTETLERVYGSHHPDWQKRAAEV